MAKMFYTLEETKLALGQTEDQIKQLTRDGRLREFRDGPRLMFKSDQVDALKATIGGGGEIDFADSGVPLSLADTRGGSGVSLGLADTGGSGLGSGIASGSGLAGISGSGLGSGLTGGGAGSGMMNLKEDTALAADLGLSGSIGGMPSPGRSNAGTGTGMTGSMSGSVGSRQGINVFGDDTHLPVDPMAQTAMPGAGSGASGADLDLQGIGSGSGLLDLTRESDDTSLGAELLDEISPAGKRPLGPPDTGSMAGVRLDAPRGGVVRGSTGITVVEAADPWAGAFGGLALGAALFLLFPIFALVAAANGVVPPSVAYFAGTPEKPMDNAFLILIIIGLVISGLFFAFGKLIQMSSKR